MLAAPPDAHAGGLVDAVAEKNREVITLTVGKVNPYKVFTLENPDRLVVDVPAIDGKPEVELPRSYRGRLIDKVRYGRFDPQTSRFVFEMNGPVRVLDVREGRWRLTIAIAGEGGVPREAAGTQWPKAAKGGIGYSDYRDSGEKPDTKRKDAAQKERKERKPAPRHEKPVIVIDPGHGGIDPGAEGVNGSEEKKIVLAYAKSLRSRLLKTGRYKVVLTRDDDTFIMLRKRVDIARKAGATLFISLHADSSDGLGTRGLSVYTLSEQASDEEAAALAARENKVDILSGVDLSDEREDVAGILISLAERETKNRSATLADMLVTSLDDRVQLLPNSHRFAGFAVLKAPDVPSVLVEIGFLSHPKEEKLIISKAYRDKVAAGIAAGIDNYFRLERKLGGQ